MEVSVLSCNLVEFWDGLEFVRPAFQDCHHISSPYNLNVSKLWYLDFYVDIYVLVL